LETDFGFNGNNSFDGFGVMLVTKAIQGGPKKAENAYVKASGVF